MLTEEDHYARIVEFVSDACLVDHEPDGEMPMNSDDFFDGIQEASGLAPKPEKTEELYALAQKCRFDVATAEQSLNAIYNQYEAENSISADILVVKDLGAKLCDELGDDLSVWVEKQKAHWRMAYAARFADSFLGLSISMPSEDEEEVDPTEPRPESGSDDEEHEDEPGEEVDGEDGDYDAGGDNGSESGGEDEDAASEASNDEDQDLKKRQKLDSDED